MPSTGSSIILDRVKERISDVEDRLVKITQTITDWGGQGVQGGDKKEHPRVGGKGLLVRHMHNWNPRRNRQNGAEEIFEDIIMAEWHQNIDI